MCINGITLASNHEEDHSDRDMNTLRWEQKCHFDIRVRGVALN